MNSYPVRIFAAFIVVCVTMVAFILLFAPNSKPEGRNGRACACASTPAPAHKFLIFWKEKKEADKEEPVFKISDKLFDSITDAWKTVPPNAAEVRIVTVRLD